MRHYRKQAGHCHYERCQVPYRVIYEHHGGIVETQYDDKGNATGIKMYHLDCYDRMRDEQAELQDGEPGS